MEKTKIYHVKEIVVIDPETSNEVGVTIYREECGGMFGIDSSYPDDEEIISPFGNGECEVVELVVESPVESPVVTKLKELQKSITDEMLEDWGEVEDIFSCKELLELADYDRRFTIGNDGDTIYEIIDNNVKDFLITNRG